MKTTNTERLASLRIGEELPPTERFAKLTAPEGGYAWGSVHHDGYARDVLGLRGGLVGGPTLYAYLEEALGCFFGPDWASKGALEARFIAGGAIDGDKVCARARVKALPDGHENPNVLTLDVWLENETTEGKVIVVGTARYRV